MSAGGTTTATSSSTISSSGSNVTNQSVSVLTGPTLNITPTITPDKKHVLLDIHAELQNFLGFDTSTFDAPYAGGNDHYNLSIHYSHCLRRNAPGFKPGSAFLMAARCCSAGRNKRPQQRQKSACLCSARFLLLGRLFTNRSKIADKKILLILVKPTIILQEEADAEAVAAMENQQ